MHGLQVFSVEDLSGQCCQRDGVGQWLDQSLFSDSQPSESEGKGAEETPVSTTKSLGGYDQKEATSDHQDVRKLLLFEQCPSVLPSLYNVTALLSPQNSTRTRLRFQLVISPGLDLILREICRQLSKDAIRLKNFKEFRM